MLLNACCSEPNCNYLYHHRQTSYEYQRKMAQAPKPLPDSFNPFATHPFTNGSGVVPRPPPPTYQVHIPSSHARTYYAETMAPEALALSTSMESTSSISSSNSNASSQSTTPLHSPKPSRIAPFAPPATARQIFVPFRKDASTPELVLKKRPPVLVPSNSMVRTKWLIYIPLVRVIISSLLSNNLIIGSQMTHVKHTSTSLSNDHKFTPHT